MPSAQMTQSFSFPGYTFNDGAAAVTITGVVVKECTIPANSALNTGVITAGVVTLDAAHTIVNSTTTTLVTAYWLETGVPKRRYNNTAVKDGVSVTLSNGAGDTLPTDGAAITLCQQVAHEINFDGDNALVVAVLYRNPSDTGALGICVLEDTSLAVIEAVDLIHETANNGVRKGSNVWNISAGDTNVFAGERITKANVSHDSLTAGTCYVLVGQ